jgi:hypothetical protein
LRLLLAAAAADLSVNDFLNVFCGAIWSPLHETLVLLLAVALLVILLLRFGVRCSGHWRRSIKSKNRDMKRERDANTDTEQERERELWGQWSFEECD